MTDHPIATVDRRPKSPASQGRADRRLPNPKPLQLTAAALILAVVVLWPGLVSGFWLDTSISAVIYSLVAVSLYLLVGRVGMVSLCQVALVGIAAWVALRVGFATNMDFIPLIVVTALITGVIGALVGLPALRLRGLYLALVTLMASAAAAVVLNATQFPNGGGGFLGYSATTGSANELAGPAIASGSGSYFRYVCVVAIIVFGIVALHVRSKPGRAWLAIRESEPAAIAAGINIPLYKMWAFALASAVVGVAGCLLGASEGGVSASQFPPQESIILLAAVLMGGAYSMWGAVIAGILMRFMPTVLQTWHIAPQVLLILFGFGVLQVILQNPGGIAAQVPQDVRRLRRLIGSGLARRRRGAGNPA
jgi:branched-chain amino acid transport system permease protein